MEVIFILGIITVIIMQFVSKAFKSATNAGGAIPPVNKTTISEKKEQSPFLNSSENESTYIDIPHVSKKGDNRKEYKNRENRSKAASVNENVQVKKNEPSKKIISLGKTSEAKRAFIYSEIFNRKY